MTIEFISQRGLTMKYDYTAVNVLGPWLEEVSKKKGESRKFRILKPLPTYYRFLQLRNRKYTRTHGEVLGEIRDRLDQLIKELIHWEFAIPKKFKDERVGRRLRIIIPMLQEVRHGLNMINIRAFDEAIYLPAAIKYESRNDYLSELRDWLILLEAENGLEDHLSRRLRRCRIPAFQEVRNEKHL